MESDINPTIDDSGDDQVAEPGMPAKPSRNILWMHKFIKSAKDASKKYWRDGRDAWNEYLCTEAQMQSASSLRYQPRKKYRIFWSSVRSIQPAYYCRTPQIVANRMFDVDDPVARVACTLAERLGQHLLKGGEFDATMGSVRDDFIMTEKATARVYFEADIQQEEIQQEIAEGVDGMQQQDEIVEGDERSKLFATGRANFSDAPAAPQYEEVLKAIKVCTLPVCFDDIIHTPFAKHWDEITELGWRVSMTRDAVTARFGAKIAAELSYSRHVGDVKESTGSSYSEQVEMNIDQTALSPDAVTWVWEIWSKLTKKVYWVSESYADGFLDVKDDPYQLVGFYPMAPFIIGTKPDKSMYPVPMYVPLRPLIEQLHNLINKIFDLITAVRRRAIADGGCEDLIAAINNLDDNEVIAVQNMTEIVEKGGVANLIQYLPLQELSNAIVELQGLTAIFKNEFFEFSGVPDLLRGSSDPIETAAAQQQKGNFLSLRFSWPQKQIQFAARDLIEMMVDLALKKFPDDYLMQVCGVQQLPPEEQQFVPQALQLLRDDETRVVRIDIETDSTSYLRDMQQQRDKQMVAQTVMQGLKEIASISQSSPALASTALSVLLFTLRSMNLGKAFESEITSSVGQMQQQAEAQAKAAAEAPPPPDYEQMKLQLEQQKMQADMQLENAKLQQANMKMQLEGQKNAQEQAIKAQSEMQANALAAAKFELEQRIVQFTEFIEQQRLQLEQYKAQLGLQEQFMEEKRLAQDTQLRMIEQQQPKPSKGPDTVIINAPQSAPAVAPAVPVLPTFDPGIL